MNDYIFKFLPIPYLSRGANYNGCDCWGLVRLYYKDILNILLPDFTSFVYADTELFCPVKTPKINDVVLIAHKHVVDHCGVVISSTDFIHTLETSGVQVSNLHRWSNRIKSYNRYVV